MEPSPPLKAPPTPEPDAPPVKKKRLISQMLASADDGDLIFARMWAIEQARQRKAQEAEAEPCEPS